jgi:ribosomal protein S18 acetylase RimI-like enzyme
MKTDYGKQKKLSGSEQKVVEKEWEKADRVLHGKDYDKYEWQGEACLTARDGEKLLGIAKIYHEGGVMWLEEFLVFEPYRGQGIGTKLLQNVVEEAKAHGCHKIILETDERLRAVDLYKKFGFEIEATLKNHYAKRGAILMSKFI